MEHRFASTLRWLPERTENQADPGSYSRNAVVSISGHADVETTAATGFGGGSDSWNPEELLLAAISQCHMLSFLYEATRLGVEIHGYEDSATASMEYKGGGGAMTVARLSLSVKTDVSAEIVDDISRAAEKYCVLRSSVNFPIIVKTSVLGI